MKFLQMKIIPHVFMLAFISILVLGLSLAAFFSTGNNTQNAPTPIAFYTATPTATTESGWWNTVSTPTPHP